MQGVVLFFSIGLFVQTLLLAYTSKWIKPLLIALSFSIFVFTFLTFARDGSDHLVNFNIFFSIATYLSVCAFLYRDWVVKKVSEFSVIVVTMTLLYSILRVIDFNLLEFRMVDVFIVVPFIVFLVFLILKIYIGKKMKIFLYSWFLLASSLIILLQLWSISYIFQDNQVFSLGGQVSLIFAGMISFYVFSNIIYILMLMPFSRRDESRLIAEEHKRKIKQSFLGQNLSPQFAFILILFLYLIFLINLQFKIASDLLLVNLMVIASLYYPSSKFIPEITK